MESKVQKKGPNQWLNVWNEQTVRGLIACNNGWLEGQTKSPIEKTGGKSKDYAGD